MSSGRLSVKIIDDENVDIARMSTSNGIKFRVLFESISPLLQEGVLTFSKHSMSIRSTNSIVAAEILFDGRDNAVTSVEDYLFSSENKKPITVGISFEDFQSCLSCVGPSDIVSLRILRKGLHASKPYMCLTVAHPNSIYNYQFRLNLLCLENLSRQIPKISFSKVVSIPSSLFLKILRCSSKKGESVQIFTEKEDADYFVCFRPFSEKKASGLFRVKFTTEDKVSAVCPKLELYSLKYLLLISKCANLSTSISIYLKMESVLGISIKVGTIGQCFFALAPCKEDATPSDFHIPRLSILNDEKFKSKLLKKKKKSSTKRKRV